MKNKTFLSTLTLFLLLQSKPMLAENFIWKMLTFPSTPFVLCIGFWSFVKLSAGKLFVTRETQQQDSTNDINDTQERSDNNRDIMLQRCIFLTEKSRIKNRKQKKINQGTNNLLVTIKRSSEETIETIRTTRKVNNQELFDGFKEESTKHYKYIEEQQETLNSEIDLTFKELKNNMQHQLEEEREKVQMFSENSEKTTEKIKKSLKKKQENDKKAQQDIIETINILKERVDGIKVTLQNNIQKSQLIQETMELKDQEVQKLKRNTAEVMQTLRRIQEKSSVQIKLPRIKESTKKLLYKLDRTHPNTKLLLNN